MKLIVNKYQGTSKRNDSLWYGGLVAEIITDKEKYEILANGDVRCDLIAKHDITINGVDYKQGDIISSVKDKNNSGYFEHEMSSYIKDDEELIQIMNEEHSDYILEFYNNNWLEVFYENDESDVLDCSSIDEAIDSLIKDIEAELKIENQNVIYCRSANYDEISVRLQEELCKEKIINDSYDLFVDNGFSGTKPFENPSFSVAIKNLNDGVKFYSSDISRMTRDLPSTYKIMEMFSKYKNSDFIFVRDNQSIKQIENETNELLMSEKEFIQNEENHELEEEIEYE